MRAWPGPDGLAVYFLDITSRRRAQEDLERAGARRGPRRAVTAELTESLDAEHAVGRLAELVVPALADWCIVTLASDDAATRHAAAGCATSAGRTATRRCCRSSQRYAAHRIDALSDAVDARAVGRDRETVVDRRSGATEAVRAVLTSARGP